MQKPKFILYKLNLQIGNQLITYKLINYNQSTGNLLNLLHNPNL